jgi:hypothetical protein
LDFIGLISACVFGPEYLLLRNKEKVMTIFGDSLMCGIIALGVIEFMQNPVTYAGGAIIWGFAPHAYNLIIWPTAALLVLRPMFGPTLMIPSLLFAYGLDELIWNPFALARFGWIPGAFGPTGVLWYLSIDYWQVFILTIVLITLIGYLIVRPRIKLRKNAGLITMLLFISFWTILGLPDGATNWYTTFWELGWQLVYWMFFVSTFSPRNRP